MESRCRQILCERLAPLGHAGPSTRIMGTHYNWLQIRNSGTNKYLTEGHISPIQCTLVYPGLSYIDTVQPFLSGCQLCGYSTTLFIRASVIQIQYHLIYPGLSYVNISQSQMIKSLMCTIYLPQLFGSQLCHSILVIWISQLPGSLSYWDRSLTRVAQLAGSLSYWGLSVTWTSLSYLCLGYLDLSVTGISQLPGSLSYWDLSLTRVAQLAGSLSYWGLSVTRVSQLSEDERFVPRHPDNWCCTVDI